MRDLTKEEKNWIKRLKRCLTEMPETMDLYISNELDEFQILDSKTKEVLEGHIRHGFEQGDPINDRCELWDNL